MEKEYPYNLLDKAYGKECFKEPLTADQAAGLQNVLESLNESMQHIITYRYVLEMPLEDVAMALKITQHAVESIDKKTIARLQQPQNATKIKFGLQGSENINDDSLEHFGLSYRTYNALKRGGITKVSDIKSRQQLLLIRHIGGKIEREIVDKLAQRGIILPANSSEEISDKII